MNGKIQNHQSFVGAMKIARNVAVSGRLGEWYSSFPAPSLRELAAKLTEGVSFVGSTGLMAYSPAHIDSEFFERLRASGDTPSVSLSLDSSLREGAGNGCGGFYHSSGCSLNRGVTGDFHRPYEDSEDLALYHSSKDTPSVTPVGRDSSLREGAGNGLVPFLVKKAGGSVEGCCPLEG